jgi:hypothetical protein
MAQVTVTNLSATEGLYIGELYTTIPAGGSIVISRSTSDLSRMSGLQQAVAASSAAVSVALETYETSSGLAVAPGSVQAQDMQPVAATDAAAGEITIRKAFTAGGALGTPDDVTIFAAGAVPYKMRILDAVAYLSTASGGALKLLTIRTEAGGTGVACAEISSASTGRAGQTATVTASQVVTPGTAVGLFIRREDRDAVGEVVLTVRRES